jgi:hypothetical protein
LCFYLDRLCHELQAITACGTRFGFDRGASVAAMQEWRGNQSVLSRRVIALAVRYGKSVEWFQSTCKMQYGYVGGAQGS